MSTRKVGSTKAFPHSVLLRHPTSSGTYYRVGAIATPHGFVFTLAGDGRTELWFIWQGREYRFSEERGHSTRGLAILAGRFARDVIGGKFR